MSWMLRKYRLDLIQYTGTSVQGCSQSNSPGWVRVPLSSFFLKFQNKTKQNKTKQNKNKIKTKQNKRNKTKAKNQKPKEKPYFSQTFPI